MNVYEAFGQLMREAVRRGTQNLTARRQEHLPVTPLTDIQNNTNQTRALIWGVDTWGATRRTWGNS